MKFSTLLRHSDGTARKSTEEKNQLRRHHRHISWAITGNFEVKISGENCTIIRVINSSLRRVFVSLEIHVEPNELSYQSFFSGPEKRKKWKKDFEQDFLLSIKLIKVEIYQFYCLGSLLVVRSIRAQEKAQIKEISEQKRKKNHREEEEGREKSIWSATTHHQTSEKLARPASQLSSVPDWCRLEVIRENW